MKFTRFTSTCVLLIHLGLSEVHAQAPESLPSPVPAEVQSPVSIEPQSLVPEPAWEEPTPAPGGMELGPPPVVEPVLPKINPEARNQDSLRSIGNVLVRKFQFTGNHVFSSSTLARVIQKYSGRTITAEELEQARQDLTLFYINRGFINSGAILPDQNVGNGVITFQIVEGKLSGVNLKGNFWFRSWWLRNEVRRAAGQPLNFNKLKEGLQLLRTNPLIARVNAELKPGGVLGESLIDVDIQEVQPFRFSLEFSNKRPPSVGAEIVEAQFADLNLTGHNDPLQVRYGIAHTTQDGGFDFSGLENIEGTYAFPVTPWATTLEIHASKSDTSIIEEPFTSLDINSKLEQYGVTLRQALHQTLNNECAVSFTADERRSKTFLLGEPFSLSPGAVDGVTDVFVLRFAQEFVNRSEVHVLALRSTFNLGLDAFSATNSGAEPNSRFFSWLGQSQYVRRLWKTDNLLVLRLNGQFSSSPLFSLEQFSIGGVQSVRGYRENTLLRDNGVFASTEVRVPILHGKEHQPMVMLVPFFDLGVGWNTLSDHSSKTPNGRNSSSQTLTPDRQGEVLPSVGLGVIVQATKYVQAEVYWGYGLNRKFVSDGGNLQDYGVYFAVTASAF